MLESLRNYHKNGFTLIELFIAIVVIALAITGVIVFFPTSQKITSDLALRNKIANSVVSKVEELKGLGYKTLKNLVGTYKTTDSSLNETLKMSEWKNELNRLVPGSEGSIDIEIGNIKSYLLSVRVKITWGDNKSYEIFTYIAP
ncbi:MAG: type IV pilus modification PilV family protein [bacterium]